ncbi:g2011 [Coccomyxa elongata]
MGRAVSSDSRAVGPSETPAPARSRGRGRGLVVPMPQQDQGGQPRSQGPGAPRTPGRHQETSRQQEQRMRPPHPQQQGPRYDRNQGPPARRFGPGQQRPGSAPGPRGQQMGRAGQPGGQPWPPAASGRFEDADEDPLAPAMGRTRGRRQSLQKKAVQDDTPEEEGGHEKAVMMRTRGPAKSVAAQAEEEDSRRPSRRQGGGQDWGGLVDVDEEAESLEGRHGDAVWDTGVNELQEMEHRDAIARFVEEEKRLAGDFLPPGPWHMPEADPPGFYPVPVEIYKDRERTTKLELLDPALDVSIGAPPPKRMAAPKLSSAEALEQLKPDIMRTLGMDPNDDEAWAAAVDGIADEVDALGITSTPDTWAEMEELEALAKELLPEGHAMQSHLQRSLRMLQANPSWPHEAKCNLLRRLAKDLTGPLPKRLQARAAALGF